MTSKLQSFNKPGPKIIDSYCSFQFVSDMLTAGHWSPWFHCELETFRQWLKLTVHINDGAPVESRMVPMFDEIRVAVYRTDREYTWTPMTGWRDITDELKDIKQQIPTATNYAYLDDNEPGGHEEAPF